MAIRRMWVASDGMTFECEVDAEAHDRTVVMKREFIDWCETEFDGFKPLTGKEIAEAVLAEFFPPVRKS